MCLKPSINRRRSPR